MTDVIKIKGINGEELEVYEDKVVLGTKGFLELINKDLKGKKTILFSSITAIQFKEATSMWKTGPGYLQFTLSGGNESTWGGFFKAGFDENTFNFGKDQNEEMKKVKQYIEARIGQKIGTTTIPNSKADEILKLKKLLSEGTITELEFDEMKKQIINKAS